MVEVATQTLSPWGYQTPALGIPNTQHAEKIQIGDITHAVLGAYVWAKWLHNHCRLGGPPSGGGGGQNQKWLLRGRTQRSVCTVQLFGRLAVLETHTL